MSKKKILFILHEAHITGATINLFRMAKWISENSDISMSFLIKDPGILINDLSRIGKIYLWNVLSVNRKGRFIKIVNNIKRKLYLKKLFVILKNEQFDIIYANTIASSPIIKAISKLNCMVYWHIHELELAINTIGKYHLEAEKYVDMIIANSVSTSMYLNDYGIPSHKIKVVFPIIDYNLITKSKYDYNLKQLLKIPQNAFIIGSSGTGTNRKGINTFIQLAVLIERLVSQKNIYYLWVGKIYEFETISYDINKSGMEDKIILPGEIVDPIPYYNIFDIFISCSKEESFGLSAIEAAALSKPLICFEKTGGLEEIVRQSDNIIIPYLNIIEMANSVIEIYNDKDKQIELGIKASNYVKRFDKDIVMNELVKLL